MIITERYEQTNTQWCIWDYPYLHTPAHTYLSYALLNLFTLYSELNLWIQAPPTSDNRVHTYCKQVDLFQQQTNVLIDCTTFNMVAHVRTWVFSSSLEIVSMLHKLHALVRSKFIMILSFPPKTHSCIFCVQHFYQCTRQD